MIAAAVAPAVAPPAAVASQEFCGTSYIRVNLLMVIDHLSNAALYENISKRMRTAFQFLRRDDLANLPLGRHDLSGGAGGPGDVFALVQQYQTKPPDTVQWEAHRKYFDVQFVVSGVERMAYANLDTLRESKAYDAETDILFLSGEGSSFAVRAGMFTIFGPQDAHRPAMAWDAPAEVRKIVVKVRVDD